MKHKLSSVLLLLVFSVFPPNNFAQEKTDQNARLAELLKRFPDADANKDGKLSLEEAKSYREVLQKNKSDKKSRKGRARMAPTHANVKYGPHERNVFDLWLPKSKLEGEKFPILIFFHGGGFVAGDKSGFVPNEYLKAGIACASSNYRFVDGKDTLAPIPMLDGARVVQTLRHRADEWKIDRGRIALSGGSAGAVMTLWIGYHDDMKNPDSADPVERESTRVNCLLPINGPVNLIPSWIRSNIGGAKHIHGSFSKMFGEPVSDNMSPGMLSLVKKSSPWEYATKDDPPTFLIYSGKLDNLPLPENASTGLSIHHPYFGKALKEKLDAFGVENEFKHGSDPRGNNSMIDFLKNHFSMVD